MVKKRTVEKSATPTARTTIAVQVARVRNLKNMSRAIPRDRLGAVTGVDDKS